MIIKEVLAKAILDSRGEKTIEVSVNNSSASAPYGASRGKHEKKAYKKNPEGDIKFINDLAKKMRNQQKYAFPEINKFRDLMLIEKKLKNKIGANTLFAFEAALLKALAASEGKKVWQIINPELTKGDKGKEKEIKFPRLLSNTIGGGVHSRSKKIKPDFQEFLVTCNKNPNLCEFVNKKAYETAGLILEHISGKSFGVNDENAWQTELDNEKTLEVMKNVQENIFEETTSHLDIGLDVAASQLFNNRRYCYKNRIKNLSREEQIKYMIEIAKKYNLFYLEDPLDEEDFKGFAEIAENVDCLVVGDDLTATNLERVKKAIKMNSVTGVIVKPNQTGSLIEVKEIMSLCSSKCVKTIVSHRSGETMDDFISDLAFALQADFIKIPVSGKESEIKIRRLKLIEESFKKAPERY